MTWVCHYRAARERLIDIRGGANKPVLTVRWSCAAARPTTYSWLAATRERSAAASLGSVSPTSAPIIGQPSPAALGACRDAASPRAVACHGRRPARTRRWFGRAPARTEPHHLLSTRRTPLMNAERQGWRSRSQRLARISLSSGGTSCHVPARSRAAPTGRCTRHRPSPAPGRPRGCG
jgi:hypothetical protein